MYVGKAKSLRKRLLSYFNGVKDIKTATLLRVARSIETILVSNEYEALLLENTLIKQHSPKYNIDLKDGKSYPVVRIGAEEFPRVFKTRHIVEDGSRYFGPFANVQAVDTLLAVIDRLFRFRKCKQLRRRSSGCMYYHIQRCDAPCRGLISPAEYGAQIEAAARLLSGDTEALIIDLTAEMHRLSRVFQFEKAATLRDVIRSIENISAVNAVVDFDPESRDYISYASEGVLTSFSVFSFRGGRLNGRELFSARSASGEGESLVTFITGYYTKDRPPPAKIITEKSLWADYAEDAGGQNEVLAAFFCEICGRSPALCCAESTRDQAVLAMVRMNAQEDLRKRLKERGAAPALVELKAALGLRVKPARIEGFDIAQLDGKYPVASLVSFKNGVPDKKNYRHFRLKTVVGIVDDFAAIREAVERRYSRLVREGQALPDFILVDGGIGQVNAAKGVLDELGVECDIAGLAKRDEEIWLPGAAEPVRLSRRSEGLKVLQAVRDETHRFATGLNQRLRAKDVKFKVLESVDGVSAKRAAAIMGAFGSLQAVSQTDAAEIARRCSISPKLAKQVRAAARLAISG
jgi:excinuclease ABC subunit C